MLDLNILTEQYFEIKLLDGRIINLRKLTQRLILNLTSLEKRIFQAQDKGDTQKVLDLNVERVLLILNHNKEGINLSKKDIEDFTYEIISTIILEYSKWMKDINSNPN